MSAQTIVVDPVTRIEGHLRIEAEFDGSVITRASSSGTMVRGIEIILRGRDPRDAWAFAQRICGVCTLVHGDHCVLHNRMKCRFIIDCTPPESGPRVLDCASTSWRAGR